MSKSQMTEKQFYAALRKLLIQYGGKREDGAPCLEATIVDRRTHEPVHVIPLGYEHKIMEDKYLSIDQKREALFQRLTDASCNAQIANGILDRSIRSLEYFEREGKAKLR